MVSLFVILVIVSSKGEMPRMPEIEMPIVFEDAQSCDRFVQAVPPDHGPLRLEFRCGLNT